MTETTKATPEQRLVHVAKEWRLADTKHIAQKSPATKDAEYLARRDLRKAVDEVREP